MLKILNQSGAARTPQDEALALDYYVRNYAPESAKERAEYADVKRDVEALKPNTVPIMKELASDKQRVSKVQIRGNYMNLGDEVRPGTPSIFPPLP
jgi:hypothetical protein